MIFFMNAQGVASQVTPSSVIQGSNNASEIVLVAALAQSLQVTAEVTLPNGIKLAPVVLTPIYDVGRPDPFGNGVGVWRVTLPRSITEFSGTATVAFAATDFITGVVVAVASTAFVITKGYTAIGDVPTTAPTYEALAAAIEQLAKQITDVAGHTAITRIALDENNTLFVYYDTPDGEAHKSVSLVPLTYGTITGAYLDNAVLHLVTRAAGGTAEITVNLGTLVGGIESVRFDDDTNSLVIVFNTSSGQQTATINLNDLLDDLALAFDTSTAKITLTAGGATKTADLSPLRDGNVVTGTIDANGILHFTLRNADGTTRDLAIDTGLGDIDAALDEIIDIQETLIGVPEYDGSITIVTN